MTTPPPVWESGIPLGRVSRESALDSDTLAALHCVLVRVAPAHTDEPTMDLQSLPVGLEVDDPEARGWGDGGMGVTARFARTSD